MDTINLKLAIPHIKQLIADRVSAENTKSGKATLAEANRLFGKLFLDPKKCPTPIDYWAWTGKDGKSIFDFSQATADTIPRQCGNESNEQYVYRCYAWVEYLKLKGNLPFPYFCDWKDEELTCLHVLRNKLCSGKPHTKNDAKYESLPFYKNMLSGLEVQFPVLPPVTEDLHE